MKKNKATIVSLENTQEGFTGSDSEVKSIENNKNLASVGNIQSISKKYADLPLKEYCIKASYNTACSGNYVSKDMIRHVLSRGCRFLDFEVFYIKHKNNFKNLSG